LSDEVPAAIALTMDFAGRRHSNSS